MECAKVLAKFNDLVDEPTLTKLGRTCGQAQRLRDIIPHRLALTFLAAVGAADVESLADVQRRFVELSGVQVSYKPFHNQVAKPQSAEFMRAIMCLAMHKLVDSVLRPKPGSPLQQFDDIVLQDGSSFALSAALANVFPGQFSAHSPAAVELHTTMSLLSDAPVRIALAAVTVGERDFLPDAASLRRKLILADRGYEDRNYFAAVDRAGGGFLIRCKANANPVIGTCWTSRGRVGAFAGRRVAEVRTKLAGESADLLVRHVSAGHTMTYRMVLIWNPIHRSHMVLATNLDAAEFNAVAVRTLYSARWQVELAFKEWKSYANLHRFDTAKASIAQGLIWASLAAAMLKRFLAHSAQRVHDVAISTRKVAMCVGLHLVALCRLAMQAADLASELRATLSFLAANARRDNRHRDATVGRLAAGLEEVMQQA
jgi:hypothetical protein